MHAYTLKNNWLITLARLARFAGLPHLAEVTARIRSRLARSRYVYREIGNYVDEQCVTTLSCYFFSSPGFPGERNYIQNI